MRDKDLWTAVDDYFCDEVVEQDAALLDALRESEAAGLPAIAVSAAQGKLLQLLARMLRAERVLEVGTLGGYSTIWLGRALPEGGKLISLELDPHHASVARANVARAGLESKVEIRVGRAIESLPALAGEAPFDFFFIDADKPSNADYVKWAIELARPGSAIVVDNVARAGKVIETDGGDPNVWACASSSNYCTAIRGWRRPRSKRWGVRGTTDSCWRSWSKHRAIARIRPS